MNRSFPIVAFLLLHLSGTLNAQAPEFKWATRAGGVGLEDAFGIALDASGNSYVTGYFGSPTITFGTTTLTSAGQDDMYIVKCDSGGTVVWAKRAGGTSGDYGLGIAVDASGNSYATGYFQSATITFGATTLTNASGGSGYSDMYVVKYGVSGSVVWAKRAGGNRGDFGRSISVDASGNSYVTGYFDDSTITFGATKLTNADTLGSDDMFIAKYDASGGVVWAKRAGGVGFDEGFAIAVDASGNSYVTGHFDSPTITFGATTLTNAGEKDMYIVKYDSGGDVLWAKSASGVSFDKGFGIALDASGNSYVTGDFASPAVTIGATTLTSAGTYDMFVAKFDPEGDAIWARSAGGIGLDYALGIAVDASGHSYVTGSFSSPSITFGATRLANAGQDDMYIVKYDSGGDVIWAKSVGGVGSEDGRGISVDASGNSYLTGSFSSPTITLGPTTLTDAGNQDVFIAKLGNAPPNDVASPDDLPSRCQLSQNYPNPFNPLTSISYTLSSGGNVLLAVYDILGRQAAVLANGYQDAGQKSVFFDASNLPSGIYAYRLTTGTISEVKKMLLIR
jgi:hypothetical protein